jgi:exoribonuclease-2
MINENALAVYKNKPALVKEKTQDKIVIALSDGDSIKVREKDIEIIHPGPVNNFNGIIEGAAASDSAIRETWELVLTEEKPLSLKELAELAFGEYSPASAWAAFCLLLDGLYFAGTISAIHPRQQEQVEADEKKRAEKSRASGERELFLERLRRRSLLPDDRHFMQDVEALAYGKSGKSRTMKDIGRGETTEDAHALLLECGFWTEQINPHPSRFGVSLLSVKFIPDPPPGEDRRDLCHLTAFAIDSPWSHDPDDAVSLETENGKQILYVHVADPAASITFDSPPEKEACGRGATLYIPEGSFRMLAEEALPLFALGLAQTSPALTFKMTLNNSGEIADTEIFPSTVKVSRLTYKEADALMTNPGGAEAAMLSELYAVAERNLSRRCAAGAININLPEIHISLNQGQVNIEPIVPYRSALMVRECMLLAGEGAGLWAIQRNAPFPYIEQEIAETPDEIFPGMAGSYQLRRCMRPRLLSVKPGRHGGLGLAVYTQVTSPLRRYTDLAAHIQIRRFLRGGELLSADEVSARIAAGEAAAAAVTQAERATRNHWIIVYLSDKKDSVWDAVALEKKGNRWAVMIPVLALETQVPLRKEIAPNELLKLILKSVNIPKGEAIFVAEE